MKPAINQLLTDDVDKSFDQGKVDTKNVKIMDLKLYLLFQTEAVLDSR